MRLWKYNWVVLVAVIVHAGWAILLFTSPAPLGATPLAETPWKGSQYVAALVYLFAAVAAILPLTFSKIDDRLWGLFLCLPQQFLLMMSAITAMGCVWRSTYADGVPRPWQFILADQLWVIVGMTVHTAALLDWYVFAPIRGRKLVRSMGA